MSSRHDAIYARISSDPEGQRLGVDRQVEAAQARIAEDGRPPVPVERIFIDNDRSASSKSRKTRDEWSRLLALVDAGQIARVYAYSNSRLTRRPSELEDLITLYDKTGVEFHTVASGQDDLSTANGRMLARFKAGIDANEAEQIGERLVIKHRQTAQLGKVVGGTRPFGWLPNKIDLDPVESAAGRRMVDGFLAGRSLHSLVLELQNDGLTTTLDNAWTTDALRKWLANPRMCGWRELRGELVRDPKTDEPVVGEWMPIVDSEKWQAVRTILDSRKKSVRAADPLAAAAIDSAPARRRYLLSGLLLCGKCMTKLRVDPRSKQPSHEYVCPSKTQGGCGGVGRKGVPLDAYVIEAVLARSENIDMGVGDADGWEGEVDLDRLGDRRRALIEAWDTGEVSNESYFPQLKVLDSKIAEARRTRDQWETRRARIAHMPTDLRAEWEKRSEDLEWRRSVIFRHLHAVVVLPVGGGRRPFDPEKVKLVWRDA